MEGEGFEHGMFGIPFQYYENPTLSYGIPTYYISKLFVTQIFLSELNEFR